MDHSIFFQDSIIREAWKLYVKKGFLKREVIRDRVAFDWERARLHNLDCHSKINTLIIKVQNKAKPKLTKSMIEQIEKMGVSCLIANEDLVILQNTLKNECLSPLKINCKLEELKTGNLSIYHSYQSKQTEYLIGAEHFLSDLHHVVDITMNFAYDNRAHYITFFSPISTFDKMLIKKLEKLKALWVEEWDIQNIVTEIPDNYKSIVITVDQVGSIIKTNQDKSTLFCVGKNLHNIFNHYIHDELNENEVKNLSLLDSDVFFTISVINRRGDIYTLLIEPIDKLIQQIKNTDLFCLNKNRLSLNNHYNKSNLNRFAMHWMPILFVGNNEKKIVDKTNYIFQIINHHLSFINIDLRYPYALKAFNKKNNRLSFFKNFNNVFVILNHIESISLEQQQDLVVLLKEEKNHFIKNKIKIVITAIIFNKQKNKINDSLIEYLKLSTDYSFDLYDMSKQININDGRDEHTVALNEYNKIKTIEDAEAETILKAYKACHYNMSKTSKILKIGRTTLYRKMKKYNINNDNVSK